MHIVVFETPGFGGLASTSEMHTIVLPIPISSQRKPPRIRAPRLSTRLLVYECPVTRDL